ncbi:hypothetical protein HPG69_004167 [Diceros bicornis minor]|uniref:Taste receptor type 2 n=1 Tax=Diceros bicornis minor TaxID=77932 RepID=A0A7J7EAS0_DICBM|nr:hypothetical protein HPG69_004167 [Diceros bicornis minor]
MKFSITGSQDPSSEAHGKATRMVTCFFSLFVLYSLEVRISLRIAWIVSNHFSFWLGTSLSIFYLVKIANFSSPIFLYLKRRVKRVFLVILLGTSVFLVSHLAVLCVDENMHTNDYKGNITQKTKSRDILHISNVTLFTLVNFTLFTMSLTSFLLLIISLWKHLKKMHLNGKGSQDPSTNVHIKAMLTVVSFLLLYAGYFLVLVMFIWTSLRLRNELLLMLCDALEMLNINWNEGPLNGHGNRRTHLRNAGKWVHWTDSQFLSLIFHLAEVEVNRVFLLLFLGDFFLFSVNLLMQDALSELWMNTCRVHERHMTLHLDVNKIFYLKSLLLLSLTCVITFLLSLTSLLLLCLSLLGHQEFAAQPDGREGLQHKGRAMKMVTTFFLLFIVYFVSTLIASWIFLNAQRYHIRMFIMVILAIFPSGHSFIIILENSKLRQIA